MRDLLTARKKRPKDVIIKETAHMYQASQAASCVLMPLPPRLLCAVPGIIAYSFVIRLKAKVILRVVGRTSWLEYIVSRSFVTRSRLTPYSILEGETLIEGRFKLPRL